MVPKSTLTRTTMNDQDPNLTADAEESHRTKGLLRLTMACNERCPFCNVPVEDYARLATTPGGNPAAYFNAIVDGLLCSGG